MFNFWPEVVELGAVVGAGSGVGNVEGLPKLSWPLFVLLVKKLASSSADAKFLIDETSKLLAREIGAALGDGVAKGEALGGETSGAVP